MVNQCTVKSFKLFDKMFNMFSIVLDNSFKRCLHSSILLLINVCDNLFHSASKASVSWSAF